MRACTSSNSRTFSIAITAWSAKVSTSSISRRVKLPGAGRPSRKNADHLGLAQERNAEQGAVAGYLRTFRQLVVGVFEDIGNVRDGPGENSASGYRAGTRGYRMIAHVLRKILWPTQLHLEPEGLAIAQMDVAPGRVAQIEHRLDQDGKNRLQIERRAADDLQHVGGGGLLLQRLGEIARARLHLVEQPHVLDRDDGLVGEGLDEFDLTGRKVARFAAESLRTRLRPCCRAARVRRGVTARG